MNPTETALPKELETVPSEWPGAFGLYKYSQAAILTSWQIIIGLAALSFAVGIIFGFVSIPILLVGGASGTNNTSMNIIQQILSYVANLYTGLATVFVILACAKRQEIGFEESIKKAWGFFLKYLILIFLGSVISIISLALLIIPFFIVAPRISLAVYYLIDKNLSPVEALKASWHDTRGHLGKLYGIFGAYIVMALPIFTLIGIPVFIYFFFMYQASYAILYLYIQKLPQSPVPTV